MGKNTNRNSKKGKELKKKTAAEKTSPKKTAVATHSSDSESNHEEISARCFTEVSRRENRKRTLPRRLLSPSMSTTTNVPSSIVSSAATRVRSPEKKKKKPEQTATAATSSHDEGNRSPTPPPRSKSPSSPRGKQGPKSGKPKCSAKNPAKPKSPTRSRAKSPARSPARGRPKSPTKSPARSRAKSPPKNPARSRAKSPARSPANSPARSRAKSPAKQKSTAQSKSKSRPKPVTKKQSKVPQSSTDHDSESGSHYDPDSIDDANYQMSEDTGHTTDSTASAKPKKKEKKKRVVSKPIKLDQDEWDTAVTFIKERPALWDRTLKEYMKHDTGRREETFEELAQKLNARKHPPPTHQFNSELLQKWWINKRSDYVKLRRDMLSSGSGRKLTTHWQQEMLQKLDFVRRFIYHRVSSSSRFRYDKTTSFFKQGSRDIRQPDDSEEDEWRDMREMPDLHRHDHGDHGDDTLVAEKQASTSTPSTSGMPPPLDVPLDEATTSSSSNRRYPVVTTTPPAVPLSRQSKMLNTYKARTNRTPTPVNREIDVIVGNLNNVREDFVQTETDILSQIGQVATATPSTGATQGPTNLPATNLPADVNTWMAYTGQQVIEIRDRYQREDVMFEITVLLRQRIAQYRRRMDSSLQPFSQTGQSQQGPSLVCEGRAQASGAPCQYPLTDLAAPQNFAHSHLSPFKTTPTKGKQKPSATPTRGEVEFRQGATQSQAQNQAQVQAQPQAQQVSLDSHKRSVQGDTGTQDCTHFKALQETSVPCTQIDELMLPDINLCSNLDPASLQTPSLGDDANYLYSANAGQTGLNTMAPEATLRSMPNNGVRCMVVCSSQVTPTTTVPITTMADLMNELERQSSVVDTESASESGSGHSDDQAQ